MSAVVIRSNITCKDRLSYFSSQWSDHAANMSMGWLTDMRLVGMEGEAWDSVVAHRAVILPLCPLLSIVERDVTKEDPTIILPDHPLELLRAFVKLVYKGSTATSEIVTIGNLLELMASLGLNMPVDRLMIAREQVNEIEIVGFKKRNGLEIIEVNNNLTPLTLASDRSVIRKSLEITPCLLQPPAKRRRLSKAVKTPASTFKRKLRGQTSQKMESEIVNPTVEIDAKKDCNEDHDNPLSHEIIVPIEVKLECEEFTVEDVQPTKKRKWNRRRETLDIPMHACEFCDFKCRFMKSLQEHSDQDHKDKDFSCTKCEFKAPNFAGLRVHNTKKHVGEGFMVCEICGFRANKKRDMTWHKVKVHVTDSQLGSTKSKVVDESCLELKDIGDQTLDDLNIGINDEAAEMVESYTGSFAAAHNNDTEEATTKQLLKKENNAKESDVTHNMDLDTDTIGILVVDTRDSTIDDAFHAEEEGELDLPTVSKVDKSASFDPLKADSNHVDHHNPINESNDNDEDDAGKDDGTTSSLEQVVKNSGELVGFQCGAPGCSRVARIKYTTATYALNRLKAHHAKVHNNLEDSKFKYINLYKEEAKIEPPKQIEENPLQILKKVKASHKKASPKTKIKPVQVRIKKEVGEEK